MANHGRLALWNDCAEGREAELERWYQTEHLAERVGVPGFARGRRYEALEARQRIFTYYETATPEVLTSPAYRERLDNPTPLTRTIMSGVILNMSRTICRVARRVGDYRGGIAVAAKLSYAGAADRAGLLDTLAAGPGFARLEIWTAAEDGAPPPTDEERLRGGDSKIAACLLVETLREADARAAAAAITDRLGDAVTEIGIYRFLCERVKEEATP